MADPPSDPGVEPDRGSTAATPRWVKMFGIIALVLVLLFAVLLLTGGHGPGRHTASGDARGYAPPSGVTEHGAQRP